MIKMAGTEIKGTVPNFASFITRAKQDVNKELQH